MEAREGLQWIVKKTQFFLNTLYLTIFKYISIYLYIRLPIYLHIYLSTYSEREEDLTGPYSYLGNKWVAFDDDTSLKIKVGLAF